jgi:acyl-CoA reductase-like NAD-dependent aldehyde dehydrogenase
VTTAAALRMGDPRDETVALGPVIDAAAATRLRAWIDEATCAGARLLCGGPGEGLMLPATVLENVPHTTQLWRDEVFGPIAVLEPFDDFDDALRTINDSDYGLQAGVFTDSMTHALRAWDALEVGGVIVGDVPGFRVDNMPYGGVKRSGLGREGIRASILEMTESRLLVIRDQSTAPR